MKIIGEFEIVGDDGLTYVVLKRQMPGPTYKPLSGPSQRLPGPIDFALSDGTRLFDDASGYWTVEASGVKIKKPVGL